MASSYQQVEKPDQGTVIGGWRGAPRYSLSRLLFLMAIASASLLAGAVQAVAHPHVWVTMTTELDFGPDGAVTGARQVWTFDDMYSAFATQGIDQKTKGHFTREELKPLAQLNVESLKEYDYFTYAKVNGKTMKGVFRDPVDYWLDYDPKETVLTLHFTLPFKTPVKAKQLTIEVYDPEFFVDFGFAEKNAVKLVSAPPQCTVTTAKPHDGSFPSTLRLDQSFMTSEANVGMGMSFANKISVKCP
jgi:ABC-type uncharacterized transport system substrate-binding protein